MTPGVEGEGLRRYSRHLLLPDVGIEGQRKLSASRVLCVGAGGLGAPVLLYLAAAGVGRIAIVDDDEVDVTNLQRQVLYREADVRMPKASTAAAALRALNSSVAIDVVPRRLEPSNAQELIRLYDVVVDCTDSFSSRYVINDACVLEGKPDVYGSIFQHDGQVSVFAFRDGPCLRCLFPEPPASDVPTCADGGVLGTVAGIVGALQANEALKLLLGIGEPLAGRVSLVDARSGTVRTVRLSRDPLCRACGPQRTITSVEANAYITSTDGSEQAIAAADLDDFLSTNPAAVLLDVREPHEAFTAFPGALAVPASRLESEMHRLDSSLTYVVACRVGQRSAWACRRLRDAGFTKVVHLADGLLRYSAINEGFSNVF